MIGAATTIYAWVIIAAACITSAAAVAGLVAQGYRDTLLENLALCAVAVAGAVVALQVHAYGVPLASGFGLYAVSVSTYAMAAVLKQRPWGMA